MCWQPWLMGFRRAMEAMLTGDAMSGREAVAAGIANRSYPEAELDERVLEQAERIAKIPGDLLALNKRTVHRAMDVMGARAAIRAGTDVQALGFHQEASKAYFARLREGVREALDERDKPFSDYRTSGPVTGTAEEGS
jgi:enoyl-CoA hydratase